MSSNYQTKGVINSSQYTTNNPGSFQTVNGKMYFFPALIQAPHELETPKSSPYPFDFKFQNEAKNPTGAQLYHANNFQTKHENSFETVDFKPQTYGDLSVHFSDQSLVQETTFDYNTNLQNAINQVPDQSQYYTNAPQYNNGNNNYPQTQNYQLSTQPDYSTYNPYATKLAKLTPQISPNGHKLVPHEREVVYYVPKVEQKFVEKEVYVPGPVKNFVPQHYPADTYVIVPKYEDVEVKFVVSETVEPEISESDQIVEVEVNKYEPEIQYVDIYVPRPIAIPIKATGERVRNEIPSSKIPKEQLEQSLEGINPHLKEIETYNTVSQSNFDSFIQQANQISKSYNFDVPSCVYVSPNGQIQYEPIKSLEQESLKKIETDKYEQTETENENFEGVNQVERQTGILA